MMLELFDQVNYPQRSTWEKKNAKRRKSFKQIFEGTDAIGRHNWVLSISIRNDIDMIHGIRYILWYTFFKRFLFTEKK